MVQRNSNIMYPVGELKPNTWDLYDRDGNVFEWCQNWYAGADGVYTFNFFPTERDERFDQLGSPKTLKGLDKVYGTDRMIIEKSPPKGRWALVAPDRLPISLELDGWAQVKLPVGEDVTANTPPGETCTARLRLELTALEGGDRILVQLNGDQFGDAEHLPENWLAFDLDLRLVKAGYNVVEVKLVTERDLTEVPMIVRLDLTVRYQ